MNVYDAGDVVRIKVTFTDLAGTPIDPGGVIARVKTPLGVKTTYTYGVDVALVKDSVGNYHIDIEPAIQGIWKYRWEGTISNKGAEESSFQIRESEFD